MSSNGQVNATGTSGSKNVGVTGTVSGSNFTGAYSGSPGTGTLSGTVAPVGSCQTQQASGGQGTFAKAFNMGTTSGSVQFSYDAYSIPDAFYVMSGKTTVFSTAGLVSGQGGSTFSLAGSSIVYVTVSAPLSGTAWEFSLSCPQ